MKLVTLFTAAPTVAAAFSGIGNIQLCKQAAVGRYAARCHNQHSFVKQPRQADVDDTSADVDDLPADIDAFLSVPSTDEPDTTVTSITVVEPASGTLTITSTTIVDEPEPPATSSDFESDTDDTVTATMVSTTETTRTINSSELFPVLTLAPAVPKRLSGRSGPWDHWLDWYDWDDSEWEQWSDWWHGYGGIDAAQLRSAIISQGGISPQQLSSIISILTQSATSTTASSGTGLATPSPASPASSFSHASSTKTFSSQASGFTSLASWTTATTPVPSPTTISSTSSSTSVVETTITVSPPGTTITLSIIDTLSLVNAGSSGSALSPSSAGLGSTATVTETDDVVTVTVSSTDSISLAAVTTVIVSPPSSTSWVSLLTRNHVPRASLADTVTITAADQFTSLVGTSVSGDAVPSGPIVVTMDTSTVSRPGMYTLDPTYISYSTSTILPSTTTTMTGPTTAVGAYIDPRPGGFTIINGMPYAEWTSRNPDAVIMWTLPDGHVTTLGPASASGTGDAVTVTVGSPETSTISNSAPSTATSGTTTSDNSPSSTTATAGGAQMTAIAGPAAMLLLAGLGLV